MRIGNLYININIKIIIGTALFRFKENGKLKWQKHKYCWFEAKRLLWKLFFVHQQWKYRFIRLHLSYLLQNLSFASNYEVQVVIEFNTGIHFVSNAYNSGVSAIQWYVQCVGWNLKDLEGVLVGCTRGCRIG